MYCNVFSYISKFRSLEEVNLEDFFFLKILDFVKKVVGWVFVFLGVNDVDM